ncbi:MAG: c-type cytochrome [Opitutales bacterium]
MSTTHAALPLHPERHGPNDLVITGKLKDLPADTVRFVRFADLAALPGVRSMQVPIDNYPGEQTVEVLFLADLLAALPVDDTVDTVLARCKDGYLSLYTDTFREEYRPFLVLTIDGRPAGAWPESISGADIGPYYITVSEKLAPAYADLKDAGTKRPWGVTAFRLVRFEEEFSPLFSGKFADLTGDAAAGRDLYMNNCMSCHAWEGGTFGGTVSEFTFPVIAAKSKFMPDYFRKWVRNPQAFNPESKMEAQSHYTDADFRQLQAFLDTFFKQP